MQQLRSRYALQTTDLREQQRQVVAVHRTAVVEAEGVEETVDVLHRAVATARQVATQRADVLGDRHAIVVEHDQQVGAELTGVVEGLERKTCRERAVTDHRHRACGGA